MPVCPLILTDQPRAAALLAPLLALGGRSNPALRWLPLGGFQHAGNRYELPCLVFSGVVDGAVPVRLGLFAAIHGDEPEGAVALCELLLALNDQPQLGQGYELHFYPVCNPSGFEDGTRHSRGGCDLNREFWRGSPQPEVRLLEHALSAQPFDGLVSLHSDDTAHGVYAFLRGATLTEALAKPALTAAARHLPLATGEIIDGFPARAGLISECYEGVLGNPAGRRPLPFEIIFETPQTFPSALQVAAALAALRAILREYRQFIAYGQDL